jgi:hypothetical protein
MLRTAPGKQREVRSRRGIERLEESSPSSGDCAPALGLFSLARLLDRSTRLNREPQTAWRQEWRIINADGSGATKASSNQFNDSKGGDKIMECKEAGSETHQQEHRFESPRAARQTKPFAEWCSRARVRFAAPSAPLPTPRHSASNQDRDGRLRRELKSLALWNFPKAAGLRPAMVMEFILTSAAFSWKRRNEVTAACPVLRSKPFAEEGRITCRRTPMRECETRRRAGVYGPDWTTWQESYAKGRAAVVQESKSAGLVTLSECPRRINSQSNKERSY